MNTPMVSVIMSVLNAERFLPEAIESVLAQSFGAFEFIVIDDGSADRSADILRLYSQKDPRMRVYQQENRGLIDSLNRAAALAQGKYLARMDGDDIAVGDRLKWQVEFLESHPEVGLISGAVEFIDSNGKSLCVAGNPCDDKSIREVLPDGNVFWHPAVLMRKDSFVQAGGYRKIKDAEDYDLWLRMAEQTRVANLPRVLLRYRLHSRQVSVTRCAEQALGTGMAQIAARFRKHGKPDPYSPAREITPDYLTALGVNEAEQQTTMARGYLSCVRNMCRVGEFGPALNTLRLLHSLNVQAVDRWVLADSYLCAASIYRRQKRVLNSIVSTCRAVWLRPKILGRPLKTLLGMFRGFIAANTYGTRPG